MRNNYVQKLEKKSSYYAFAAPKFDFSLILSRLSIEKRIFSAFAAPKFGVFRNNSYFCDEKWRWPMKWLKENVTYGHFDDDLWVLLQSKVWRQKLRDYIVEHKLTDDSWLGKIAAEGHGAIAAFLLAA